MVTSYRCVDAVCVPSAERQTDCCTRVTMGATCGATTVGAWSACGGYADSCDETGSRARTITEQVCAAGACQPTATTEYSQILLDARPAGRAAVRPRTRHGPPAEASGRHAIRPARGRARVPTASAIPAPAPTPSRPKANHAHVRPMGLPVGAPHTARGPAAASHADACDEGGSTTCSPTDRTCASGTCVSAARQHGDREGHTRSTDGSYCEDISACATGHCDGGYCPLGHGCTGTQRCCEPGMCLCATCFCRSNRARHADGHFAPARVTFNVLERGPRLS